VQITALEQLKGEIQEELFQQSVDNTQLHTANQNLTAQLAKAEERNTSLDGRVTSLNDERLKVAVTQLRLLVTIQGLHSWSLDLAEFSLLSLLYVVAL